MSLFGLNCITQADWARKQRTGSKRPCTLYERVNTVWSRAPNELFKTDFFTSTNMVIKQVSECCCLLSFSFSAFSYQLSIYLSIYLSVCMYVCIYIYSLREILSHRKIFMFSKCTVYFKNTLKTFKSFNMNSTAFTIFNWHLFILFINFLILLLSLFSLSSCSLSVRGRLSTFETCTVETP